MKYYIIEKSALCLGSCAFGGKRCIKMKTLKTNNFEDLGNLLKIAVPDGMSDVAFKSMVARNGMTPKKINALEESVKRGKELVK